MKQIYKFIYILLTLLLIVTNAWAECTIFSDDGEYTIMEYKFPSYKGVEKVFTITNPQPSGILTFTYSDGNLATGGVTITATYSDNSTEEIIKASNASNQSYNFNGKTVKSLSFIGTGTVKKSISNVKLTRHTSISASTTNLSFPLTAVGYTSAAQTVTVTYANIGKSYKITPSNTDDFSISPSNAYDNCAGEMSFSITFHPKGTTGGQRIGSFTIAGDGDGKSNDNISVTINVSGMAKGFPEHTWKGEAKYYVDDMLDLSTLWYSSNGEVECQFSIIEFSSSDTYGSTAPHFIDNTKTKIALSKAGTLQLQMQQTSSTTYSPLTSEVTIEIAKHTITPHINPSSAVWNELVTNPFSASSTHKVTGTVTSITDFSVTQQGNEHIATLNNTDYTIQTYYTNGAVDFLFTRPEDYKYNALSQSVTLNVNQSRETCNLITDETAEANHSTGQNSNGTYSKILTLDGMADKLIFKYYLNSKADYNHYVTPQYSTTEAGDEFYDITTFTTQSTTPTSSDSIILPTGTKRIRFKRTAATLGTKNILLSNITVTRAKDLTPHINGNDFYLTQISIRMNFEGTFLLDWSTCADEILLTCDHPSFVITPNRIDASEQKSGTTPITITCRDENATNIVGKVTIYDQTQKKQFNVHCKYLLQQIIWDQYFNHLETDETGNIIFEQALNAYAATADGTPTGTPITYTLDENAQKIARLETTNGVTTLYITGQGDGKITASAPAIEKNGKTYSADEVTRDIRVRKYGDLCNTTYYLSDRIELYTIETSEPFDIQSMNAGTLLFTAHRDAWGSNFFCVQFSNDYKKSWTDKDIDLQGDKDNDYTVLIPEGTTHLRFATKTGATLKKYIKQIRVKQKMELSPDTKQINETIYVNTPYKRTIRVTYSDIPVIQTTLTQNTTNRLLLTPDQPINNNCGDYGTYTYTLSGEWSQPQTVTETLQFFTSAGLPQTVKITLHVIMDEQDIVSVQKGSWSDPNTWNKQIVPQAYHNVQVQHEITISTEAEAHSITMEQGATLSVTSQGGLTIHAGGFTTANTTADITLEYLQTGSAYLLISPEWQGTKPKVKVRYQTKSTLDTGANQDATWQYIGAPGANCQFTVDYITWLYQWSEPQNWLNKTGTLTLTPFAGYAITQYGKPTYELIADPINQNQTITLTKTSSGMNGNNLFANSFMAPIDAKNFTAEDFSDYNTGREDIVKTFYLFNSGSWNDWNKYTDEESKGSNGNDTPGQYCAIPALASQFLNNEYDITTIPPMQGVYMIANSPAEIYLNYEKHVWNANSTADLSTNMHEPMRSPSRYAKAQQQKRLETEQQMQQPDFRRIRIQLNSANSGADRLYIIQSDETTPDYDNGYDAPNQTVSGLTNIYTTESFGKMEVSCSNHIDSMYIGFQAGSDTQYTLSFSSLIGDMLYLEDLELDTIVAMQPDMPYTFTATALSINDHRFRLLLSPKGSNNSPTDTEDINNIYIWINNNVLHITGTPANSTMQIYDISGIHILTQAISDTPYTYNLSHLPAGVYLVRINNYTYKVIKK